MKGKSEFSKKEEIQLRQLISEKTVSSREKQKQIRDMMRTSGFYISDFTPKKGFSLKDFDHLISNGQLVIK